MKFEFQAQRDGVSRTFFYDNHTNLLTDQDGTKFAYPAEQQKKQAGPGAEYKPFSKTSPLKKTRSISILKIQMGLSCNYSCDYCSQRFVERPPETSKKHIEDFLVKLDGLDFPRDQPLKIEFWGGEPLVYWKTMKPLAEALRAKYMGKAQLSFSTITNGSLLTPEICDWLYFSDFSVGISHDGPGQYVRGDDPFDDPVRKKTILDFYYRMKGRISFNAMLNSKNIGRKDIHDWFVELTGDPEVLLGEGAIVDAYDEGGYANMIKTKADHFQFRKTAFNDIYSSEGKIGFRGIVQKVDTFIQTILNEDSADFLPQKCGMDQEHIVAVDLKGNVITCQNVSSVQIAGNGEAHFSGTLDKIEEVEITTATHWSNRPHCTACPVLNICRGSCMYLEDEYWNISCQNAYTDNLVLWALGIEKITGFIPTYINDPSLPPERRDIWGDVLQHTEEAPKRKSIPIKLVAAKTVVEGTEVYLQAAAPSINGAP